MKRRTIISIIFGGIVLLGIIACVILTYHDYVLLRDSPFFAEYVIGPGAQRPPQADAYKRLKINPFASLIFKRMEKKGNNEAKVYAIEALKKIDPDYYMILSKKYESSSEIAIIWDSCTRFRIELKSLFED